MEATNEAMMNKKGSDRERIEGSLDEEKKEQRFAGKGQVTIFNI